MIDETIFPFLAEKGHVVSLVGGGGKTTLLHAMAAHCARRGWHVLAATTTHIQQPPEGLWAQTDAQLEALWAQGRYAVAGTVAPGGKLTMPPPEQLHAWMQRADAVFLEADGAKCLPCKAPAAHEPVLLPESDILLAVAGLSALGRPLQEVCFRLEQAQALLNVPPETVLTPTLLASLLASEQGGRKLASDRRFRAALNQADTPERVRLGRKTQRILHEQFGVESVLTFFEPGERA